MNQEAVCPECKHSSGAAGPAGICVGCPCPRQHPTLRLVPAPVVPSDDAPRREQYATSDEYRAAMVEWALSAPPTPSQDAEGDGWRKKREDGDFGVWADFYQGRPISPFYVVPHGVESAIREPYEALVKSAYRERAQMAVALARLFPSWVNIDPEEPDWPVLYVQLPTGQASWHFSPSDRDLLEGITIGGEPWDGHTTEEKYARLRALSQGGEGKA